MARNSERMDSFSAVERRIEVTRKRLPRFPHEQATLTRLIAHIQKRVQDRYHRVLKPHGLNYAGYNALMVMYGTDDYTATPSQLVDASGEKPTNITRICDDLLAKGLIERHPSVDDRRRVEVTLTRKGIRLVEKLQPDIWQHLGRLYAGFSAAEMAQYARLLRKQMANLEREA